MDENILKWAFGLSLSIVVFFLKSVHSDHKETKKLAEENKANITRLKDSSDLKFDNLISILTELKSDVKRLISK